MLTPFQFASNIPIRYIDLDGLENGDPMYYLVEGFRQYFDVGVNLFTFDLEISFNFTDDNSPKSQTGSTTISSSKKVVNSTSVGYNGWDLFKPGAYPVNNMSVGTMPVPKVKAKNTTTVQNTKTIKVHVSPTTVITKQETTIGGETTNTTNVSTKVNTNTGVPVTFSASNSNSSAGTTSSTAKVSVGPSQANIYIELGNTKPANSKSTGTANFGLQSEMQTPPVGGYSIGYESKIQAGIKLY